MTRTIAGSLALAWAVASMPAHADIYTWVDKNGEVNISNLAPPDDVKITRVERTAPKDAAREAARQAELRVLNERVSELRAEVDRTRREAVPPPDAAPPVAYLPAPAYPPIVVNVVSTNTQDTSSGACDAWSGTCGVSMWPGYFGGYTTFVPTYVVAPGRGHKGHRRMGPTPVPPPNGGALIPPLIPMPARASGARLG